MGKSITRALRLCCTGLVAGTLLLAGAGSAIADPPHRDNRSDHGDRSASRDRGGGKHSKDHGKRVVTWDRDDRRHDRDGHRDRDRDYAPRKRHRDHYYTETKVIYRDRPHHRKRQYRDVLVVRPYGYWYPGYGHYHHDDDAYKWLSFTAIALKFLDNLNEQQQREHEAAQVTATTAPIGETIIWREGGAAGAVTATREGTTPSGRYCREFLQEVTIGGRKEAAYGTACRQPDGAWEVISAG